MRNHKTYAFRKYLLSRSQWQCSLRCRSAAAGLLRLWVRIPPGEWMSVVSVVLSGISFYVGLVTRPEESYRLWCVVVCDLETSWMRRPWPWLGFICCFILCWLLFLYWLVFLFIYNYLCSLCLFLLRGNDFLSGGLFYVCIIFAFLVRIPMFMVHLWLPRAHNNNSNNYYCYK